MIIVLPFKEKQLTEIKNKISEINFFYKYLTQRYKILVNEGKILIKLKKLRKK